MLQLKGKFYILFTIFIVNFEIVYCVTPFGGVRLTPSAFGGSNFNAHVGYGIGSPSSNLGIGAFASGNTFHRSSGVAGGFGTANINGHSIGIQAAVNPSFGASSFSGSLQTNLIKNDNHRLDLNLHHSHDKFGPVYSHDKIGASVDYKNFGSNLETSLGASHIPKLGETTVHLTGSKTIWEAPNKLGKADVFIESSYTPKSTYNKNSNYGVGVGLKVEF